MSEFFQSKIFKLFLALAALIFILMLRSSFVQGNANFFSDMVGIVTTPLQKSTAAVSESAGGFWKRLFSADELYEENQQLKEQIRVLTEQQVELEQYRWENESLKEFMGLKEEHPDHEYVMASVVSRDPNSRFHSFVLDKGSLDGVEYLDPVITEDGLVGRISEVGLTFSKVTTILDPALHVGAYNARTRDMGTITGRIEAAEEGLCSMELVSRSSTAAKDDIIVTAGSTGLFPKDLVIGRIVSLESESDGKSMTAMIQPAAEVDSVTNVLVVTSFRGQGSSMEQLGEEKAEEAADEQADEQPQEDAE